MSALQAKHVADRLTELGVRCRIEGPDQEGRHRVDVPRWDSAIASMWEAEAFLRFVRSHLDRISAA